MAAERVRPCVGDHGVTEGIHTTVYIRHIELHLRGLMTALGLHTLPSADLRPDLAGHSRFLPEGGVWDGTLSPCPQRPAQGVDVNQTEPDRIQAVNKG